MHSLISTNAKKQQHSLKHKVGNTTQADVGPCSRSCIHTSQANNLLC